MEEKVLDKDTWKTEAQAVINDIKNHVAYIDISKKLPCGNQKIYLNMKTLENNDYCVEMSGYGFKIVGEEFDKAQIISDRYFETPYSLLDSVSGNYQESFGNELMSKLNALTDNE